MENKDLKWIKKHYGEKFAHLCRTLFPTILENEGMLIKLLITHFPVSRDLYEDIVNNQLTMDFKNYIFKLLPNNVLKKQEESINFTPEQLMDKAGYILYPECQTEEDIQKFRHYYYRGGPIPKYHGGTPVYYKGEELCTFNGGRLNSCRVWFAVKKNVDQIRREDFANPRREDDYGTSVISIQFSRGELNTLSIKNRYNHTIKYTNPDCTFGNNLDNIIEGLTYAFVKKFGLNIDSNILSELEIPGYIQASYGKFYKYNIEINNIYYCPNNTIIEKGEVKTLDKDRYLLLDNFVLDFENKIISWYDSQTSDSFPESVGKIKEIKRLSTENGMTIIITPEEGELVEIQLDKRNQIIKYANKNIVNIKDNFMLYNNALVQLDLPNLIDIGNRFIYSNNTLTKLELPKVENVGDGFLFNNNTLSNLELPKVENVGDNFMCKNNVLTKLDQPNVRHIGDYFMYNNNALTELNQPQVENIGDDFMYHNNSLTQLNQPKVENIGNDFMCCNRVLTELNQPQVENIGDNFIYNNYSLTKLDQPNIKNIGNSFLFSNVILDELNQPNVRNIGDYFLCSNKILTKLSQPKVECIGNEFMYYNKALTELNQPKLRKIGKNFLYSNRNIRAEDVEKDN